MNVIVAKSAGFCWGVRHAVERACDLAQARQGPVYTDGPLIHNEQVMAELGAQGVTETRDPDALKSGTLIVRAHGIPPERRQRLKRLPVRLIDCTCRDVARIQGQIKSRAALGDSILIFGDPGHAEVLGLLGFAGGRGHVVASPAEVDRLPDLRQVCLVAQSTQFPDAYAEIAAAVRRRFPDATVLDTICEATKRRQGELREMADHVDAFVVLGSRHSANTVRLAELAARLKPTVHVETAAELDPAVLRGYATVGITAGASTPDGVIDEVRRKLEAA